jgi:hypothetical protein
LQFYPGFKKEQLRVQIDNFGRFRISGERPLRADSNRWRCFSKDFHVPDGCNAGAISARLEKSGALLITMPRLSPPAPAAASTGGVDAAQDKQKDHHASGARQEPPPAAAADEAAGEQKEEDVSDASTERRDQDEQHLASNDAGREASAGRPACGFAARSRRSMVWAIVAVVLTLVGAGLYARYRLMDPTAETAPTGSQIVPLSDH